MDLFQPDYKMFHLAQCMVYYPSFTLLYITCVGYTNFANNTGHKIILHNIPYIEYVYNENIQVINQSVLKPMLQSFDCRVALWADKTVRLNPVAPK